MLFSLFSFQFAFAENNGLLEIEINSSSPEQDFMIGTIKWLEENYLSIGTGVVRVIDNDMNLDFRGIDSFTVDVWSDSDAEGIELTVTETRENTGVFEGTVFFSTTDESSNHRLKVTLGDTVTSEYGDDTLPYPYMTADELDIAATTLVGLSPSDPCNLRGCHHQIPRVVDAFGNILDSVYVDQQVQISTDFVNGQNKEQTFAYLVQIHNNENVVVYLKWISGTLKSGQSFSPALSWIPLEVGTYTATAFSWDSVDNANPLSRSYSTIIDVEVGIELKQYDE